MTERSNVVKIQGNRLCEQLGLPVGTKIPKNVIEMIAKSKINDVVSVCGKEVVLSPSVIAVAGILVSKKVLE